MQCANRQGVCLLGIGGVHAHRPTATDDQLGCHITLRNTRQISE